MKYFSALLFGAALTLTACSQPDSAPSAQNSMLSSGEDWPVYKRPNLVVSDIDRAMTIYVDLLGFEAGDVQTSSADSFSYPVFQIPRDAKIRFVTMNDSQDSRAFALTEVTCAPLASLPATPHLTAHVIGVTDLKGKIAAIERMGLTISPAKTAQGSEFTFIEQAFTDYDGHLIVLYEILPDGK